MQNIALLKPIIESENPHEVFQVAQEWMRKETAVLILLRGVKSAAEVYFRSTGSEDIDYSRPPEEFIHIYGDRFLNQPFFETLHGSAKMLSDNLLRLQPSRTAVQIAFFSATVKTIGGNVVKIEMLEEDIREQKRNGYPMPMIAKDL